LSQRNPLLAWLPVETVIRDRQAEYYAALAFCDKSGQSTAFIEFLLSTLLQALHEASDTDQVSDQVKTLLRCLAKQPLTALACMKKLSLYHRPTFRKNHLQPAMDASLIERTLPDKPNNSRQQYRLCLKK
jgi:hypothetical protein